MDIMDRDLPPPTKVLSLTLPCQFENDTFSMSPNEILQECKYSLKQIDPATYGYFIRKTQPFFGAGWWPSSNQPLPPV